MFFKFLVIKTLDPYPDSLEILELDPDPESINPDPKHCKEYKYIYRICIVSHFSC
jgi:hypothetical protein